MQIRVARLEPRERFRTLLTRREGVVSANGYAGGSLLGEGHRNVELEPLAQSSSSVPEQKVLHRDVMVEVRR